MVSLLLLRGVNPCPLADFDVFKYAWEERLTPMGHAIEKKSIGVVEILLEHGVEIDSVSRQKRDRDDSALSLFFDNHEQSGSNSSLLKLLLEHGARVDGLKRRTIFAIGVYANVEELRLLASFGFDLQSCYNDETSILDLAMMQEQKANLFHLDEPSREKVLFLLKYQTDKSRYTFDSNGEYISPYSLRKITLPESVQNKDLIQAVKKWDLAAFMTLIEEVDVNQRGPTEARWTCLHHLFAELNHGSVSEEYDYVAIAQSKEIHWIDYLIKRGARPLRDEVGRTPLMCLTLNSFNRGFNRQVIDRYAGFEATFYNLDPEEYKQKLFHLRDTGFSSQEILFGTIAVPIASIFNRFWKSFFLYPT